MATTSQTTSSGVNEPYLYQRPSSNATRAMVESEHTPHHVHRETSPSGIPSDDKPALHRRKTHNYEDAMKAAAATTSGADVPSELPHASVSSHSYRGEDAKGADGRPGMLGRQQSWKPDDVKRANMERMLSGKGQSGQGYSSGH